MEPQLEQDILDSSFAGLYVVGKSLQLFARLKPVDRKMILLRLTALLKTYGVN